MALRRRKPPSDTISVGPTDAAAPKGTAFPSPSRRISPKLRQLAFILPFGLLALYLLSRTTSAPSLGSEYAVCTREKDGIITMNEDSPSNLRTQCLVVKSNKVAGAGSIEEVRDKWGDRETLGNDGIKIVWLRKGETVLPGLIDAHAHVLQNGEAETSVNLVGAQSTKEVRDRIAHFIEASPSLKADKSRFILGLGWDQTKFGDVEEGAFPTAADLDSDPRLKGRPITLKRIDVHALWVSEKILDLLPSTLPEKVPGGSIIRSPTTGKPTGIFLDNAMNLVTAVVPPWTDQRRLEYLRATSRQMLKHGLTSVHDAALTLADIDFLKKIDKEDMLPVRIYGMLSCENPLNSFCGGDKRSEIYEGHKFNLRAVKLFIDGALGSWGSAMHEPYSDKPDSKGILICGEEELNKVVRQWVERGYQVNSHGIGDLANTLILKAYDQVLSNSSLASYSTSPKPADWTVWNPLRLRIEHAQILRVEDIERMGELGIVASFQPTHATSDMDYVESRIGPERVKGAYAWRKIISSGAPYALGSDFPVESVDPFLGLYAAITRKYSPNSSKAGSPHGSDRGWYEEESMTPLEALRGFTSNAAKVGFQEDRVGILREGMEADFIIVRDGDVLELGQRRVGETERETRERERRLGTIGERVKATVVGGRILYGRLL